MKQLPLTSAKLGQSSVAIFSFDSKTNGKGRMRYSVVLNRSYEKRTDKASEWITETIHLFPDQVSPMKALLTFAEEELLKLSGNQSPAEQQIPEAQF